MSVDLASAAARLADMLRRAGEAAIITHRNADLDAIASAMIVARIAESLRVKPCLEAPEGPGKQAKDALSELELAPPGPCEDRSYRLAIAVDSTNSPQLGSALKLYLTAGARVVVDHHEPGSLAEASDLAIVDPDAASTTEITVLLSRALQVQLAGELASLALLGIVSDSRKFSIAGPYTFKAAQMLVEMGGDYGRVMEFFRKSGQQAQEDLSLRIARLKAFSRLKLGRACHDILVVVTHIGSHESAVARSLISEGADVAVVVVERREGFRVSVRVSQRALTSGIQASKLASFIAEKFGGEGGGHEMAGMAHLPHNAAQGPEELVEELAERLPGKVGRICVEYRASLQEKSKS